MIRLQLLTLNLLILSLKIRLDSGQKYRVPQFHQYLACRESRRDHEAPQRLCQAQDELWQGSLCPALQVDSPDCRTDDQQ